MSETPTSNSEAFDAEIMAAWNIKSGGYASYAATEQVPVRQGAILDTIDQLRKNHGVQTLTLTDAHHWDRYGDSGQLASFLDFREARFTRIDDERLNKNDGSGIGLVVATNRRIARSGDLDLGTRQGLGVILDIGKHGLQLAGVYLDDLSEDTRAKQVRALLSSLEPDMPTIINGDFNALRADLGDASISVKARDMIVRALALALPKRTALGATVHGMNKRTIVPTLEEAGYLDADEILCRPTAKSPRPLIFGLDYAFHNAAVSISNFHVPNTGSASDHRPIVYTAQTAN